MYRRNNLGPGTKFADASFEFLSSRPSHSNLTTFCYFVVKVTKINWLTAIDFAIPFVTQNTNIYSNTQSYIEGQSHRLLPNLILEIHDGCKCSREYIDREKRGNEDDGTIDLDLREPRKSWTNLFHLTDGNNSSLMIVLFLYLSFFLSLPLWEISLSWQILRSTSHTYSHENHSYVNIRNLKTHIYLTNV